MNSSMMLRIEDRTMQVILLEKMQKLGDLGDEVAVKSGFGRNFLIPQGKALTANKANREVFETRRVELEAAAADALTSATGRMKKVEAAGELALLANAGIEGKLFGSIGAQDIADALNEKGADVQRHEVRLPTGALRHTGEYEIDIQMHADVIGTVKLNISSEAELEAKAAAEEAKKAKAKALAEAEKIAKEQEDD